MDVNMLIDGSTFIYKCKKCGEELHTTGVNYFENNPEMAIEDYPKQLAEEHYPKCSEYSVMIALTNYYNLVNELEIYSFIKENKNINSFLLDAYQQMEKVFGENVKVTLKKKDNSKTSNSMLVAYIDTSHLSVKDARKMLRQFKFDWYLKNNERVNGRFIIHVT